MARISFASCPLWLRLPAAVTVATNRNDARVGFVEFELAWFHSVQNIHALRVMFEQSAVSATALDTAVLQNGL